MSVSLPPRPIMSVLTSCATRSPRYAKYSDPALAVSRHLIFSEVDYAITHNLTPFISMQNHYSLLYREEEREMMPTLKVSSLFNPHRLSSLHPVNIIALQGWLDPLVSSRSWCSDSPVVEREREDRSPAKRRNDCRHVFAIRRR